MKKQILAATCMMLLAFATVACGEKEAAKGDSFATKLETLKTAESSFENALNNAKTLDEAKQTPEYAAMTKALDDATKAAATATPDEKKSFESVQKMIDVLLKQ